MESPIPPADAVVPVQDDSRIVGNEVQTLEEMLSLIREDDQQDSDFLPVLDHVRHFFLADLLKHLHEEEQVFFPAVEQQLPQGYWKMVHLRKEHDQLREAIERFRSALALEIYLGPQAKQQHLWWLVNEARKILALLKTHAAFEIDLAQQMAQLTPPPPAEAAPQQTEPPK
jgi:iron-sulfur cluster repair protein YtfE (RIC family)